MAAAGERSTAAATAAAIRGEARCGAAAAAAATSEERGAAEATAMKCLEVATGVVGVAARGEVFPWRERRRAGARRGAAAAAASGCAIANMPVLRWVFGEGVRGCGDARRRCAAGR